MQYNENIITELASSMFNKLCYK